MHWPIPDIDDRSKYKSPENKEKRFMAWKAMQLLEKEGKARKIGISNFMVNHLEHFLGNTTKSPYLNQVEFHPYLDLDDLKHFCDDKNIIVEGYSSLGHGNNALLKEDVVISIAKKLGKKPAQILLSWSLHKGVKIIPKSGTFERIKENFDSVSIRLDLDDIEKINSLRSKNKRFCLDPNEMF
ncbi:hypothetical protein MHBO_001657 [Bonamia ostreae]